MNLPASMFRSLFSFIALLLSIGTVILIHASEILDNCDPREYALYVLAYGNATVWMVIFVFLCLPFLHKITKLIYLNALPALLGFTTSCALFFVVNQDFKCGDEESLLLTTASNLALAFVLLLSEMSCAKKKRKEEKYQQIS